jgi:calcineurin-like phosphoesterase family protein
MTTYFFTADEHYGHANIIRYCNRPFQSAGHMDAELIARHNQAVSDGDTVIHAGDFTLMGKTEAEEIISHLNGRHVFLRGSHDYWLEKDAPAIWENKIDGQHVVVCHYAMRVWARSHYNSWQLFGHSHGQLEPVGKQWDIGVDNNDFRPLSLDKIRDIMASRPDNPNFIPEDRRR